jgi:hypothetical protein
MTLCVLFTASKHGLIISMPKAILVPIPPHFKPLIDEEVRAMGCYGIMECMGRILDAYFNQSPEKEKQEAQDDKEGDSRLPRLQATVVGRH